MSTRPRPASVVDADRGRRDDLAAIHMGAKALGWSDEQYRDLLWTVCQVRSAGSLDFAGRKRFLAHLRACGWEARRPSPRRTAAPWNQQLKLLWALWQQLADAGLVQSRGRAALEAWVRRRTKVDALEFLNPQQRDYAIEMAKQWLKRRQEPV